MRQTHTRTDTHNQTKIQTDQEKIDTGVQGDTFKLKRRQTALTCLSILIM